MAEVLNPPLESQPLDRGRDHSSERKEKSSEDQPGSSPPPHPPRRRDRDSRERRDDKDQDRPHIRRAGDSYDRNRSPPPPLPPRERDRERDYKRRLSPTPPPYRDRRPHSPPPRRSPPFPPFKRSRRDDGYDGRRGSPRGGYGHGDRRFGYDYAGAYDRGIGGRTGYADDRPHGRYMSRSSGSYPGDQSDWSSVRGGFNDASFAGNTPREGLMSYKQFIQELEDDVLPAEAERRYLEYKSEYISTQKRTYFDLHKDDEWLKDKYHPTNLVSVIERRKELAQKAVKDFLLELHSGSLDIGPGVNPLSLNKSGKANEPTSDDEADGGKRRRHGRPVVKNTDPSAALKAHPISSEPRRMQVDIELAHALVRKLDSEKAIEGNILSTAENEKFNRDKSLSGTIGPVVIVRSFNSVKGLEGVELLDTLLTYLWRVHGLDYYGMTEVVEAKGFRHVRAEGKTSNASGDGVEWEKKLDTHWQERLRNQDPLEIMAAKEKLDAAAVEVLDPHVRKIRDEKYGWKYGCGAKGCTKLFHAPEYVHKHLKLKHSDLVMELTSKLRDDLYFQNYMNDPDAPGGQPVIQQSTLRDKLPRGRMVSDNRFKDDRVSQRKRDPQGSGAEKFDRSDKLDGENDGDKENADEPMFDSFIGPGIHVSPFAPDIPPPPVLMPVPGAGPLGPFVPAPPEVAMRMLREQGGPHPLDGAGRNGRPGLGATPIILPPSFPQDPRRLRSYEDLDAPEEEVTVIDYRSL